MGFNLFAASYVGDMEEKMKYLGRPKICCANCESWEYAKPHSDGQWGKCAIVGRPTYRRATIEDHAVSTQESFWCCNFRLRETAVKLSLIKDIEWVE